jgi:hypothetical protein
MRAAVALAFCLVAGCGKPSEAPAPSAPTATATPAAELFGTSAIKGKVVFKGEAAKPATIKMSADPYCEQSHGNVVTSEEVLVNDDGTLRNVFVYVKQGVSGKYPPPGTAAVIDQSGCMYRPRVQGIQVGQPLVIRNSDDTLHNIHSLSEINTPFNLGQPARGMEAKKSFTQPEVMVHFKCDVHPWMNGYIGVLDHPFFAVTGDGGTFKIEKLPAGEYVIEAWHEKLGVQQQTITIAKDETKTTEFVFDNQP